LLIALSLYSSNSSSGGGGGGGSSSSSSLRSVSKKHVQQYCNHNYKFITFPLHIWPFTAFVAIYRII